MEWIVTETSLRYYFIAFLWLVLDQWTKYWVVTNMELAEQIPVIDGFFYITSHRNRGAAFGILQNQTWLFISITIIVVAFVLVYIWKMRKNHPLTALALSFVLGGALGNLIDRVRTGEVVDFFHFQYKVYQFPIFNIADSVIVCGVILLMIITILTPSTYDDQDQVSEVGD